MRLEKMMKDECSSMEDISKIKAKISCIKTKTEKLKKPQAQIVFSKGNSNLTFFNVNFNLEQLARQDVKIPSSSPTPSLSHPELMEVEELESQFKNPFLTPPTSPFSLHLVKPAFIPASVPDIVHSYI